MRGILDTFMWASSGMIPVPRPRQPREVKMKCGNQPADIRMIHRRKDLSRVALLILCDAHYPAKTLHHFVNQRETASFLLTGKAISEVIPQGRTVHARRRQEVGVHAG
jgi:hypothetical protein